MTIQCSWEAYELGYSDARHGDTGAHEAEAESAGFIEDYNDGEVDAFDANEDDFWETQREKYDQYCAGRWEVNGTPVSWSDWLEGRR